MKSRVEKIGIVGFGASGLTCFIQLIDACIEKDIKVSVSLFDKKDFCKGQAYGTPYDSHLLNLDTHTMSVVHTKVDDFYTWFTQNEFSWKNRYLDVSIDSPFPPRKLFGEYLESRFQDYTKLARSHGIEVNTYIVEVIDVNLTDNEYVLQDATQKTYHFGSVILCVGNPESDLFTQFRDNPMYHHSPWEEISSLDGVKSIAIIGSRLTAIDTALFLSKEKEFKGKTYLISRSGQLPRVIGPSKPYVLKYLNRETIERNLNEEGQLPILTLWHLFRNEIESAEEKIIDWESLDDGDSVKKLREEIEIVTKKEYRMWQSVLIAFYPIVPWTWSLLSDKDKKHFIDKYLSLWFTYLAAFPVQNAQRIYDLVQNGSLSLIGGLQGITIDKETKKFKVHSNESEILVDVLINATGSGHTLKNIKLLDKLKNRGLIKSDPAGGISSDIRTCEALSDDGTPSSGLYSIGETTFGDWLATADLGQISRQAALVMSSLTSKL